MAEKIVPPIRHVTEEEITAAYHRGDLLRRDYMDLLTAKAHDENFRLLEEEGVIPALGERMLKHLKDSWEQIKSSASDPDKSLWRRELGVLWGEVQMLMALPTATGEVAGHTMEKIALANGVPPTLARILNFAADIGVGVMGPSAIGARSLGRTVQDFTKGVEKKAEAAVAETPSSVPKAFEKAVEDAVKEEGVQVPKPTPPSAAKDLQKQVKKLGEDFDKGVIGSKEYADGITALQSGTTTKSTKPFQLPYELKGAKPRFSVGDRNYFLDFKSDLDKALFILAQTKPSKSDAKYLKVVQEHLGLGEQEIRALGQNVKQTIKDQVMGMQPGVVTISPTQFGVGKTALSRTPVAQEIQQDMQKVMRRSKSEKLTKAELKAFFEKTHIDPQILAVDRNWTEKQLHAYVTAIQPHIEEIASLAQRAVAGDEQALWAMSRKVTELIHTDPTITAPQLANQYRELLTNWDPQSMAAGRVQEAMMTMARDIATLNPKEIAGGSGPLTSFLVQMQHLNKKHGTTDMVREVYANILLPFAWAPTFVGNTFSGGMAVLERALGAVTSSSQQGYKLGESYYLSKGMMLSYGDALKSFGEGFQQTGAAGRIPMATGTIPGKLGALVRTPTGLVRGMDNVFYNMFYRGALYARYFREASEQGLRGKAVGDYIARQMSGPPTREAWQEAKAFAEYNTFQNQLGGLGQALQKASGHFPLFFYFPFIKSGINLAKYTWARTPGLNLISTQLYKDLAAGGATADAAQARLVMGNLMASFIYDLAREDYITGGGPKDPGMRKIWLTTHQPYSVRTPHGWMSYKNTEPLATALGLIADFKDVAPYLDEATAERTAMSIVMPITKNIFDSTWFRYGMDLSTAIEGVQGGQRLSEASIRALFNPVITVATGGPLGSRVEQAVDPTYRETRGVVDEVVSRVPGWSGTLNPVRDAFGDIVVPPSPPISNWFGLLRPVVPSFKPYETDPIKIEGAKIGAKGPVMSDRLGSGSIEGEDLTGQVPPESQTGIRLTPQEFAQRQEIYRNLVRDPDIGVKAMIDDPQWNTLSQALKREQFSGRLQELWTESGAQLRVNNPTIEKRLELQLERRDKILIPDQSPQQLPLQEPEPIPDDQRENLRRFE